MRDQREDRSTSLAYPDNVYKHTMIHQPDNNKEVEVKKISCINTKSVGQNNHRRQDQIMPRDSQTGLYHEEYFNEFLAFEKKRYERSEGPAFLMLADLSAFTDVSERQKIAKSMTEVLSGATRDTDVKGWHVDGFVIGIMFTEMGGKEGTLPLERRHVTKKCLGRLQSHLGEEAFSRIQIDWQPLHSEHIRKTHTVKVSSEQQA